MTIKPGRSSSSLGARDPRATHRLPVTEPRGALRRDSQGNLELVPLPSMQDSSANTIEGLRAELNALLQALRQNGFMET